MYLLIHADLWQERDLFELGERDRFAEAPSIMGVQAGSDPGVWRQICCGPFQVDRVPVGLQLLYMILVVSWQQVHWDTGVCVTAVMGC